MNAEAERAHNRERVFKALSRQVGAVEVSTIVEALGLSRGGVRKHLDDLVEEGLATKQVIDSMRILYTKAI